MLATVFGALSIVIGLLGAFLAGWIGVCIVVIFGAVAIFFRIRNNKADPEGPQKKSAIVCGIVGIALALITQIGVAIYAGRLKADADKMGDVPLVSAGADGLKTLGFFGLYSAASEARPAGMSDDDFGKELKIQLEKVVNQ